MINFLLRLNTNPFLLMQLEFEPGISFLCKLQKYKNYASG